MTPAATNTLTRSRFRDLAERLTTHDKKQSVAIERAIREADRLPRLRGRDTGLRPAEVRALLIAQAASPRVVDLADRLPVIEGLICDQTGETLAEALDADIAAISWRGDDDDPDIRRLRLFAAWAFGRLEVSHTHRRAVFAFDHNAPIRAGMRLPGGALFWRIFTDPADDDLAAGRLLPILSETVAALDGRLVLLAALHAGRAELESIWPEDAADSPWSYEYSVIRRRLLPFAPL